MRSDPQRSPPCCAYLGRRAGSGAIAGTRPIDHDAGLATRCRRWKRPTRISQI